MSAQTLNSTQVYQQLKPIYLALLVSLVANSALVLFASPEVSVDPRTEDISVLYSSLAFGACLLGMVLNHVLLKPKRALKAHSPEGAVIRGFIISWVCFETAAIIGVILVFISGSDEHYWSLLALSTLSMLSHPPHEGRVKRALGVR